MTRIMSVTPRIKKIMINLGFILSILTISQISVTAAFGGGSSSSRDYVSPSTTKQRPLLPPVSSTTTKGRSISRSNKQQQWFRNNDMIQKQKSTGSISDLGYHTRPSTTIVCGGSSSSDNNESISNTEKRQSTKSLTIPALLTALSIVTLLAKNGILHGPLLETGDFGIYTNEMILQDIGATFLTGSLGYVLVKIISLAYEEGYFGSKIARKLVHTLSAPLFILFWPIFSEADGSRFFAGVVTLVNIIRLYIAGTGGGETSLANSVSRSGDKSEALGGPFVYVCILLTCILLFWRSSMIGVIALCTMAAGDGMADLIGRRWGRTNKWFFSDDKSIVGSIAFIVASSLSAIGLINWLIITGCLQQVVGLESIDLFVRIVGISSICALVELLPIGDDNYTVPLSAAILSAFLLH